MGTGQRGLASRDDAAQKRQRQANRQPGRPTSTGGQVGLEMDFPPRTLPTPTLFLPVLLWCLCACVQEARPRWWRLELALQPRPSNRWALMLLLA